MLPALSFAYPWFLGLLFLLPLLYWLIKITPPKPKTVIFPTIGFLLRLQKREESTASLPWWLLLLRLSIAALIIIALSGPQIYAPKRDKATGPAVILVDNGWASGPNWEKIKTRANQILDRLKTQNRLVYLVPLAGLQSGQIPTLTALNPQQAVKNILNIKPRAWQTDRAQITALMPDFQNLKNPSFFWLSDGVESHTSAPAAEKIFTKLATLGPVTIFSDTDRKSPLVVGYPEYANGDITVPIRRAQGDEEVAGNILVKSTNGQILAQRPYRFDTGSQTTEVRLTLPLDLQRNIRSVEIQGSKSTASKFIFDDRSRRRSIGLAFEGASDTAQALLSESHYVEKALSPYFALQRGTLAELLAADFSTIILGDSGSFPIEDEQRITNWIKNGGTLIRFAGPKLANSKTSLVPVKLRAGSRSLDGSISWTKPTPLGKMPASSPFSALAVPPDIKIKKQVLAYPAPDLSRKTWAILSDGTPLVTVDRQGKGTLVLFHVTATPKWSNLPLSGLFVEMLREIGQMGRTAPTNSTPELTLPAFKLMDGFGQFSENTAQISPLNFRASANLAPNADHPAGFYGTNAYSVALNIGDIAFPYRQLQLSDIPATREPLTVKPQILLQPVLLLLAFLLVLLDLFLILYLQGRLHPVSSRNRTILALSLAIAAGLLATTYAKPSLANSDDQYALEATLQTRLGYVVSGIPDIDRISAAGLTGLSSALSRRTAIETVTPLPIRIEDNDLIFFPFIYWPITPGFPPLSNQAIGKVHNYLSKGGTILFDTRNQNKISQYGGDLSRSPENIRLQQLVARLQVPQLAPLPPDHVLTRAFYLMQSFPGRYTGGNIWLSQPGSDNGNDDVSSVIIGSNDWAAAWAIDAAGKPIKAVVPGGPRQREFALRFGINLTMYTLTGNYKADQVHIPTILKRLNQ